MAEINGLNWSSDKSNSAKALSVMAIRLIDLVISASWSPKLFSDLVDFEVRSIGRPPFNESLKNFEWGRQPWSSGYGRRLLFKRLWVWIPALYTGCTWHFWHWFVIIIVLFTFDKTKNKRKIARGWPIFKNFWMSNSALRPLLIILKY